MTPRSRHATLALPLLALASLAPAAVLDGVDVTYYFEDPDDNEVFDVLVEITGGSAGLATYDLKLIGLEGTSIDAATIHWNENALGNFDAVTFLPQGFFPTTLLEGTVGEDGYHATNRQGDDVVPGIGVVPVDEPGNVVIPGGPVIFLSVPALLGELLFPGASILADAELLSLLRLNAEVLVDESDRSLRMLPGTVSVSLNGSDPVVVRYNIPEPSATALLLAGLTLRRQPRHASRRRGTVEEKAS